MQLSPDGFPSRSKASWRGAPIGERLQFIKCQLYVMYPGLVRLLNETKRRYKSAKLSQTGEALLAIISSGGGKTHLIRLLKLMMPDEESQTHAIRHVVAFSIPARPTHDSMTRELLRSVGDLGWNQRFDQDPLDRAVKLMKGVEVKVVCIDNTQDIPERRGKKGVLSVGNWIRDLWDKCDCLILLLGTPAAKEIIWANEQLRRRSPAWIEVPYFDIRDERSAARSKRFLARVDEELPLAELSGLAELVCPIFWATYGIHDYIFNLLRDATAFAVAAGRESITRGDLRLAFSQMMQDAGVGINPFDEDGPQRPLDQEGEPFFNWHGAAPPDRKPTGTGRKKDKAVLTPALA